MAALNAITSTPIPTTDQANTLSREQSPERQTIILLEFLYHGSCPNCHHFHIAKPITLPTKGCHARYYCDACQNVLFGAGRSSAQTSLASVRTNSDLSSHDVAACAHGAVDNAAPEERPTITIDRLAIDQHQEARRSRSQSQVSQANNRPATGQAHGDRPAFEPHQVSIPGDISDGASTAISKNGQALHNQDRKYGRRYKVGAQRLLRLVKSHFPWIRPSRHVLPTPVPLRDRPQTNPTTTVTNSPDLRSAPPRSVGDEQSQTLPADPSPPVSNGQVQPLSPALAEPRTPRDETAAATWNPIVDKNQRIRNHRAEQTLKKRRLRQRRCYCHEDCHCMGGPREGAAESHRTNVDSNAPQHPQEPAPGVSSHHSSEPPDFIRPHSPSLHVAFMGAHFQEELSNAPPSSDSLLSDYRFSRQSTSTGMSQATTAVDSRSSGTRSDPRQIRRSRSLPLARAELVRPEVLAAIRQFEQVNRRLSLTRRESMPEPQGDQHRVSSPSSSIEFVGSSRTASVDFASRRPRSIQSIIDGQRDSRQLHISTHSLSDLSEPDETIDEEQASENTENGAHTTAAGTSSTPAMTVTTPGGTLQNNLPLPPSPETNVPTTEMEELASHHHPSE